MRLPKYELEPLVELRQTQLDTATRGMADAVQVRQRTEQQRRGAEERRDEHDARAVQVRRTQDHALGDAQLCAGDLATMDAWEDRIAAERQVLTADVQRAASAEATARVQEEKARGQLVSSQANAKVVQQDRERWQAEQRRKDESRQEDEADDALRAR
jgi:hypothetical protein